MIITFLMMMMLLSLPLTDNKLGKCLYSLFFGHYTKMAWMWHPRGLDDSICVHRIKMLPILKALKIRKCRHDCKTLTPYILVLSIVAAIMCLMTVFGTSFVYSSMLCSYPLMLYALWKHCKCHKYVSNRIVISQ